MTRSLHRSLLAIPVLLLAACAGGGVEVPPPAEDVTPAGQSTVGSGPEVEIYTAVERLIVQGFRIDFPELRNVHALIGWVPENWEQQARFPFESLREFQIRQVVDTETFDKIHRHRQEYRDNPQEFFRVLLVFRDGGQLEIVAILPKFRGVKDNLVWEQPMAGNGPRIDRVVFPD
jgi:hypothetical protein